MLQEPRHWLESYWDSWPSLTSVVEGRGCPPSEVTCGGQNEHGRRVIVYILRIAYVNVQGILGKKLHVKLLYSFVNGWCRFSLLL